MNEFLTKVQKPMIRVEYTVKGQLMRRDYVHKRDAIRCLAHWIIADRLDDDEYVYVQYYKSDVVDMLKNNASMDLIHGFIDSFDLQGAIDDERSEMFLDECDIPF